MGSSRPINAGARRRPRDSPHVTLPSTWPAALPFSVPPRTRRNPTRSKARAQPPPPAAPSGITPLTQRRNPPPQCKGGVRVPPEAPSGASPPHAARHNITPAPVKPQGVPVRRPPPAKSSPESPRVHNQSLSSRDAPPQRKAGVRVPPEAPSGASTPHGKAQYPPSARKATGGTRAAASPIEAVTPAPTEAEEPQTPPSKTPRHADRAPPSGLSPCPRLIYP